MNQAIIINDDYSFNENIGAWQCTAMLSGNKMTIFIQSNDVIKTLTQDIKFDWECCIEEWLEENEPDHNNHAYIHID